MRSCHKRNVSLQFILLRSYCLLGKREYRRLDLFYCFGILELSVVWKHNLGQARTDCVVVFNVAAVENKWQKWKLWLSKTTRMCLNLFCTTRAANVCYFTLYYVICQDSCIGTKDSLPVKAKIPCNSVLILSA